MVETTLFRKPQASLAAIVAVTMLALGGCTTAPVTPTDGASAKPAAPAAAPAATPPTTVTATVTTSGTSPGTATATVTATTPAAGQPRPFAEIIKDAKLTPGLFPTWQKDEKVWLEIAPEQFGKPFLFSANLSRGIGEQSVYGGMMLVEYVVELKRIGTMVQLIAKNHEVTADKNEPMAQGVREGFTDSLLGSTTVAGAPHPERKTILIDANALLLTDIPVGTRFTYGIHMRNYTFDARNSSFDSIRNTADQTSIVVSAHYANPKATLPPPPPAPPSPFPPFRMLPDGRSLFLGYTYNFATLPPPMAIRRADPRIGHFNSTVWNFSSDTRYSARTHHVNRWRLEKADPTAALSAPKQPLVYWIDRTVPEKYRDAVRAGILEWNKAFEKIGFKDALIVKQQDNAADFDTFDARHSTVRWFVATDAGFAIGPSSVDPRTGEILNAQVAIPESWARGDRTFFSEQIPGSPRAEPTFTELADRRGFLCSFPSEALAEMQFGLDLLEARGDIEAGSPEADAFINAALKSVVMHEVGHTLGLTHNFRASTAFPLAKIADPAFTAANGISGSVMDYNPMNIAVKGEPQGAFVEHSLGPYDYWAIEYAYKPLPPETENEELARIAARGGADPLLAFSSDQEVSAGLDPDANQFDLGSDPLEYLQRRLVISQELWQRLQQRKLKPGESYDVLRRSFDAGFRQVNRAATLTAKYVGGVYYVRDFAGTANLPLTPVPPERQRAALKLLATGVFAADSFRFDPVFLRSMGVDYLDAGWNPARMNPDFSLRTRVLGVQTAVLNQVLADSVLNRLLDSGNKVGLPDQALTLDDLFAALRGSIWSELKTGTSIPAPRRDLQREHLRRITTVVTRPVATTPADALALFRDEAKTLSALIRTAARNPKLDRETRAHLTDSAGALDEALKATFLRTGV